MEPAILANNTVLVIDDQSFRDHLTGALSQAGYNARAVDSLDAAIEILKTTSAPTFILTDRMLTGERVEDGGLARLHNAAVNSWIVVYTTVDDITPEERFTILDRGALRVLGKEHADKMALNVKIVTDEFEELLGLKGDMEAATTERNRIFSALLGTNVAVCIVDRAYKCWFANGAMERLVGGPVPTGVYWKAFHGFPERSGPNGGCPIKDVFDSGRPADKLLFMRFTNGLPAWFSVRATPIISDDTNQVVAVQAAIMAAGEETVGCLSTQERLQKIAQSLVWFGFGRARIYQLMAREELSLVAAAAITDSPLKPYENYFHQIKSLRLKYGVCPYVAEAIESKGPVLVESWDRHGPSPYASQVPVFPPYALIPLFFDKEIMAGLIALDCDDLPPVKRALVQKEAFTQEGLRSLSAAYGMEAMRAIWSSYPSIARHAFHEAIHDARIRVGAADSVESAKRELLAAFERIVRDCRVSVRILRAHGLERYASLCQGEPLRGIPPSVQLADPVSLSAYVARAMRPLVIDDYPRYRDTAREQGLPIGHLPATYASILVFPLLVEGQVVGSITIASLQHISWQEDGYVEPLQSLANIVALVVRDVVLSEAQQAYERLFQTMPVPLFRLKAEGTIFDVNEAMLAMLGYHSVQDLQGRRITDILINPESEIARAKDLLSAKPVIQDFKCEWRRSDGTVASVVVSARRVENPDGTSSYEGAAVDLTSRLKAEEALRASEKQFRELFDEAPVGYLEMDARGVITRVNRTELRLLGYSPPEDMIGRQFGELVREGHERTEWNSAFTKMLSPAATPSHAYPLTVIRKDGAPVPVLIYHNPILDASHVVIGVRCTMRDISTGLHAESTIIDLVIARLSAQRTLAICFLHKDEGHHLTFVNSTFLEELRPRLKELNRSNPLGLTDYDIYPRDVAEQYARDDDYVIKHGIIKESIERHPVPGGTERYVQVIKAPLRNHENVITGVQAVFWDVREAEEVQETLERLRTEYQALFEPAGMGFFQSSPEGRFLYVNAALARMLGYTSPEELLPLSDIGEALYVNPHRRQEKLALLRTQDVVDGFQYALRCKEGDTVWVSECAHALRDGKGNVVGIEGTLENITKRKRDEEMLRAKEAAEEASRTKGIFLANMSHEIRTPMNAILGFSQLMLRDSALTDQQRHYLDRINRNGEYLLSMINDVLEVSKIEAGKAGLNLGPCDLHAMINDLEATFNEQTRTKGLTLAVNLCPALPHYIVTDEAKLRQVFVNLLNNAVKFTERGGVTLRVDTEEGRDDQFRLLVEVEDTGPGICEEEIGNLFRPFEQASAGVLAGGGVGLGLALSQEFIRLMGGSLALKRSEVGVGSCFRFEIPFAHAGPDQVPPGRSKQRVIGLVAGRGSVRVLIVDDNEDSRAVLSKLLHSVGFETRETGSGESALKLSEEWQPHLILMDERLPGMNGREATRRIKQRTQEGGPVIISVTASAFEEDRKEILEAGANGYLRKPFKEDELFGVIHNYLGVDYVYAEEPKGKASECDQPALVPWSAASVSKLSPKLLRQLRRAAQTADMLELLALAKRVAACDTQIARETELLARRFDYRTILKFLETGGSK